MNDLIEKLQREKRVLFENLNKGNYDKILKKSEEIEVAIKNEKKMLLLSNVNGEQSRLREKAKQAWECEVPTADITCNDGSFHAAKVKKYPKIAELKYASGLWKEGMLMEIRVNGIKFRMFSATYEHSKPTEYKRP
ncbi:MAG: hypothetical protein ABIP51_17910, partial [Bacteroidia bacterium]